MDKVWYYMTAANRKKYGPYDDQELIALIHQETGSERMDQNR